MGRSTPLQLAASRGHVNAVRFLVEAGADKTGAAEAAQELSKLGAVFSEAHFKVFSCYIERLSFLLQKYDIYDIYI